MPWFDLAGAAGKIEPAPLRDRLDLIVAGTASPSPSAFHIIDHLVAGAPREEATKCREPSRTPISNCRL
jgi:hypothetical protein